MSEKIRIDILTRAELLDTSQKSCCALGNMEGDIKWLESVITDDQLYFTYIALSEKQICRYVGEGEVPVNNIFEVKGIIYPTTAE